MENEFEERVKELKRLYDKADAEPGFRSAMFFAKSLQNDMESAKIGKDKIYDAVYYGIFARYYLVRKYARTASQVESLVSDVSLIYRRISKENAELKVRYGYLLSIIYSELDENPEQAEEIGVEVCELAETSNDFVFLLREFNAHGLREKKLGNYQEALDIFGQVDEFLELENPETVRHIANILGNIGRTKLDWIESVDREQGDITFSSADKDLIKAGRLYLSEENIPAGHIGGLFNQWDRVRKIADKFTEKAEKRTEELLDKVMKAQNPEYIEPSTEARIALRKKIEEEEREDQMQQAMNEA